MPDENRSERLPLSTGNEPPLQRAMLIFLVDLWPQRIPFDNLARCDQFRAYDDRALRAAVKSLHLACLVNVDEAGRLVASSIAQHFHWLIEEVETPDAS